MQLVCNGVCWACAMHHRLNVLQDLEGFDEEAERRQQATAEAASKGRSPFKQGRNQAELGPGPLATGLTGSGASGGSNTGMQ